MIKKYIVLIIIFSTTFLYGYTNPILIKSLNDYKLLKSKKIKNKEAFSSIVIQNFYSAYSNSKNKKDKALSLYMIGKTYLYLTESLKNGYEIYADLTISSFYRLTREFPHSSLSDDAYYYIAYTYYIHKNTPKTALRIINTLLRKYPKGDYKIKALTLKKEILKKNPKLKKIVKPKLIYKNKLLKIRDFVGVNYFRIVFDFLKKPEYEIINQEFSISIILKSTLISKSFKIININNKNFNKRINIEKDKNNLIISINTDKIVNLKYFVLKNPYRLVIDVEEQKEFILKPHERIQTIVLDPGHGGKDPGAMYYGLKEKDVTLKIAKMVRSYLYKLLPKNKFQIYLTRQTDRFIELEDRVKYANKLNADLFVSIHCNASKNKNLKGLQTFYLNPSRDRVQIDTSNDVQAIIDDLMKMARVSESVKFAETVHYTLFNVLRKRYKYIEDHGVKKAPFYVLVSTKMPAILVEVSFISNPLENKRLRNIYYLKNISYGISKGIVKYIKHAEFTKN